MKNSPNTNKILYTIKLLRSFSMLIKKIFSYIHILFAIIFIIILFILLFNFHSDFSIPVFILAFITFINVTIILKECWGKGDFLFRKSQPKTRLLEDLQGHFLYNDYLQHENNIVPAYFFKTIYSIYFLMTPISNFLKRFSEPFPNRFRFKNWNYNFLNLAIEIKTCIYLFIWIIVFAEELNYLCIIPFMLWRATSIFFIKFQEITFYKSGSSFQSYTRTLFLTMVNFLEIIFIFSHLYFSKISPFNIPYLKTKFQALRETLYICLNWNLSSPDSSMCTNQEILILFQTSCFFILVMISLSNINSIKYSGK